MNDPAENDPLLELRYSYYRNREETKRIRRAVLDLVESGTPQREIARRLEVTPAGINYWLKVARQERDQQES